jgi:hypothetical protein
MCFIGHEFCRRDYSGKGGVFDWNGMKLSEKGMTSGRELIPIKFISHK